MMMGARAKASISSSSAQQQHNILIRILPSSNDHEKELCESVTPFITLIHNIVFHLLTFLLNFFGLPRLLFSLVFQGVFSTGFK